MYSQMLEPSSPFTWTATFFASNVSDTLASLGTMVWKSSPLSSLPLIWELPPLFVAIVTDLTLPSFTCRTNSE